MPSTLKRYLQWSGSILAFAGMGFIALRLRDYGADIDFTRFDSIAWLIISSFVLIYGFANLKLAFAWRNLLTHYGFSVSRRWALKVYGVSQLAKYVPGNIFHLAGRQAIGMAAGIPAWPLAKSSLWELGLLSAAGGLFVLLALPFWVINLPIVASVGAFLLMVAIGTIVLRHYVGTPMAYALGWYIGFLMLSGFLFAGLIELVSAHPGKVTSLWIPICGAYVLAWLVGLVTPGAPAGVGVRELVLLFLLKGIVTKADLLLAIVLGRMVTVLGDLLYFFAALLFYFTFAKVEA